MCERRLLRRDIRRGLARWVHRSGGIGVRHTHPALRSGPPAKIGATAGLSAQQWAIVLQETMGPAIVAVSYLHDSAAIRHPEMLLETVNKRHGRRRIGLLSAHRDVRVVLHIQREFHREITCDRRL